MNGILPDFERGVETMTGSQLKVVVTGDTLVEWRFARSSTLHATGTMPETGYYMQCNREESCAEGLGKLLSLAAKKAELGALVMHPEIGAGPIEPGKPPYWHTYMLCTPYAPFVNLNGDQMWTGDELAVWRVNQRVGHDRQPPGMLKDFKSGYLHEDKGDADVVVIEDASYGFGETKEVWPLSLREPGGNEPWAIMRWKQRPEGTSSRAVWEHLSGSNSKFKNRIILVLTADDLRLRGMRISRELTWERAIEDLAEGLRKTWSSEFAACSYLVVSFFGAGAAVFARTGTGGYEGRLYYDPLHLQETWAQRHDGSMFGYTRCLTAAVTLQLLRIFRDAGGGTARSLVDVEQLGKGIIPGLFAQHRLLREGFHTEPHLHAEDFRDAAPYLSFPVEKMAETLVAKCREDMKAESVLEAGPQEPRYVDLAIPKGLDGKPAKTNRNKWNILTTELADDDQVLAEAKRIVERGIESGKPKFKYPLARFGALYVTDRTEIESYSSLASLIENYMGVRKPQKPLSVAVFGVPGSGKSFGVKEVAKKVAQRKRLTTLTFNLSQLSSPSAIKDALHQVRDAALSGEMPLVFWDEFDTALREQPLGWLRYFLAPMQDGTFQEGPVTHNVGHAIFVFGGGTHATMNEFMTTAEGLLGERTKATDFISRLSGYVDVMGINYDDRRADPSIALRRAVLLHAFLKDCGGKLEQTVYRNNRRVKVINVDPGLIYAFLRIERYVYAARSMGAIIKMSALTQKSRFEPSILAPSEQMRIHVDEQRFIELLAEVPDSFLIDSEADDGESKQAVEPVQGD